MESGELMLRVHDECLILNVYKSMHSYSDAQTCMKINSIAQATTKPPDITTPRQKCKVITLRRGKSIEIQDQESAEDSYSPPFKEKKKKEPIAYMPKPPYPQRRRKPRICMVDQQAHTRPTHMRDSDIVKPQSSTHRRGSPRICVEGILTASNHA
ncbi:hypothetical protein PIB30_104775 [Stylosanthes scabra]|uniref:Uncharacterized protein n=1 Tax=Stylosanthes scabra TaxID=79078 RepID=A0ABU6U0J3_9FABA|nr:hypothetical protein [Stylosanthes scabra]